MKMKYAAVASICVLAVLCSSASVLFASDSDADAAVYDGYYKNQLTSKQVDIYTALTGLTPSVAIEGNETDGYYITVSCTGLTSDDLNDIERAWFATKLEASEASNWAFWAWNTTGVKAAITNINASGFRIGIDAAFKDGFADKVTAVTNAVNAAVKVQKVLTRLGEAIALRASDLFSFDLNAVTEGAPMPKSATKTATGSGLVIFGGIEFTQDDIGKTFRYEIAENVPDDAENSDGVKWADASEAQRKAGGFRKDDVIYSS
ncbi:MAG: FctA domain-containing protein, partial [Methanomethylophilus sp.]|nr:FctA domain-containing protein [Methanomethylophilus sp.]